MKVPKQVIEEIERKADIVDIVGSYVSLTRRGSRYWGLSPFTNERTPSFSVSPDKGLYYCFSSQKGGSVFTFIMEMEGLTFPEAAEFLAERLGIEYTTDSAASSQEQKKVHALKELYKRVSGSFRYIITEKESAAEAREYLAGRGISPATQELFQVGYAPAKPQWLYDFLRKKDYSEAFLAESGLFSWNYPGRALFVHRVVFPIRTYRGDTVGFGGRRLAERGPKYINSPDTPIFKKSQTLYGLYETVDRIKSDKSAYLCEGYLDVLAIHQSGVGGAVAPLGTAFTEEQGRLLRRYAEKVILVFDADEAGLKATRRAAEVLERAGLEAYVAPMPSGSDPADILVREGSRELENVLHYTLRIFDFLVERAVEQVHESSPEGKEFVLRLLFPYIKVVESAVKREAFLQVLAERLGVDADAVASDFEAEDGPLQSTGQAEASPGSRPQTSDLFLMLAVAVHRDSFAFVRKLLTPDDLRDQRARELFISLEESYRAGERSLELLQARIESQEIRDLLIEKSVSGEFSFNSEKAIADAVYRVKERSLREQQKAIDAKLQKARANDDAMDDLLQEKMYLDGELKKLRMMLDDRTSK
jgi:DNA primase